MSEVLDALTERLALLQKYEARFGPLDSAGDALAISTTTKPAAVSTPAPTPQLNGLHVTIPQPPPSNFGSASAGSGVNTPESAPY